MYKQSSNYRMPPWLYLARLLALKFLYIYLFGFLLLNVKKYTWTSVKMIEKTSIIMSGIIYSTTYPTKLILALCTCHVVASGTFLNWTNTFGTNWYFISIYVIILWNLYLYFIIASLNKMVNESSHVFEPW